MNKYSSLGMGDDIMGGGGHIPPALKKFGRQGGTTWKELKALHNIEFDKKISVNCNNYKNVSWSIACPPK
jgi:hypothetical protein